MIPDEPPPRAGLGFSVSLRIGVWDDTDGWAWYGPQDGAGPSMTIQLSADCVWDARSASTPSGLGLPSSMWLLVPENPPRPPRGGMSETAVPSPPLD